jgi:Uma2 family endonuclease
MGVPAERLSLSAFFDWENSQADRHEYIQGEVFAMTGARRTHGEVVGNLFSALKIHLRGRPCRAYMDGMKLQIADDTVFYPDIFVTCDPRDLRTEIIFRNPKVVVEVLSPSTAAFDQGLKFAHYRRIVGLSEYVLIDPDTKAITVFRRNAEGNFVLDDQSAEQEIKLASLDFSMLVSDLFEGLEA